MVKITDLLYDFQDLFPTKFADMKWILVGLGETKIQLNPDAKPIKQRLYRLNLWYKERVEYELDRVLVAGIIETIEESKWISPMVVQDKKTGEV